MSTFPLTFALSGWYSVPFIATRLKVSRSTVTHWARNGLFTRMGLKVIYTSSKGWAGGRVIWVHIPDMRKFAMFRNLPIDILSPPTIPLAGDNNGRPFSRSGPPSLC